MSSEKINIPKVSIIVPVYNAGDRFVKCMDTLVNQTLRDIEIILVLDCPTDGTDLIAKEYASKDERITVLENSTNLHIGESRNRGIDIAKGEYIGFSDHDDYRELNMYEELYNNAKIRNCDIVLSVNYYTDKNLRMKAAPQGLNDEKLKEYLLDELISDGDEKYNFPLATNVHPNIYKRSFIEAKNLRFVDTRNFAPEDRIFQIESISLSTTIELIDKNYYHHILHSKSAVHGNEYKSCRSRANGKNKIYIFLKENGLYEKYKINFFHSVKREFADCLINNFITRKNLIVFYKEVIFMKSFPFCKEAFRHSSISLKNYRIGGKLNRILVFQIMKI